MPNRDRIIGLCFVFELNLNESNCLLKAAWFNELYLRNTRDLIIMKSLNDRIKLDKYNRLIINNGFKRIGNLDLDEKYIERN